MKEIEYIQVGDYQLPNLKVEEMQLISKNELNDYLLKVQKEADDLYDRLVEEYKTKWNVTEELKQNDQMKWVQMMNNIKKSIEEIVFRELIK